MSSATVNPLRDSSEPNKSSADSMHCHCGNTEWTVQPDVIRCDLKGTRSLGCLLNAPLNHQWHPSDCRLLWLTAVITVDEHCSIFFLITTTNELDQGTCVRLLGKSRNGTRLDSHHTATRCWQTKHNMETCGNPTRALLKRHWKDQNWNNKVSPHNLCTVWNVKRLWLASFNQCTGISWNNIPLSCFSPFCSFP